jgi:hypothetical protein
MKALSLKKINLNINLKNKNKENMLVKTVMANLSFCNFPSRVSQKSNRPWRHEPRPGGATAASWQFDKSHQITDRKKYSNVKTDSTKLFQFF